MAFVTSLDHIALIVGPLTNQGRELFNSTDLWATVNNFVDTLGF